jgi:hypothetical protein
MLYAQSIAGFNKILLLPIKKKKHCLLPKPIPTNIIYREMYKCKHIRGPYKITCKGKMGYI